MYSLFSIRSGFRRASPRVVVTFILVAAVHPALAQQAPLLRHLADVKKLTGTLVAQSQLAKPETALGITGYRIEHVILSAPATVRLRGRTQEVREGWHVTVSFARRLTVRDQAFSLVIDGRWCGFLQEAPDLKSADTVCFDAELVRDGAALGVTYRGVQIASRDDDAGAANVLSPEAVLGEAGEDLHYASDRLRLRGVR